MTADDFVVKVGLALAELRESRGMTQSGLAEASGVDQATIAKAETGVHFMRPGSLLAVCHALKVPLSEVIRAAESKNPGRSVAALDEDESGLVTIYQCCSAEGRKILLDRAQACLKLFPRK